MSASNDGHVDLEVDRTSVSTDPREAKSSNLRNDLEALDKRYLRLLDDYQKVVIANVEVAKVNVEQAETIERLRAREAELLAQIESMRTGLDNALDKVRRRL